MSIPLAHEDELDMSLSEAFGLLDTIEMCHFCSRPTRFMNLDSSTHVCVSCSFHRLVSELPRIECSAPRPKVTILTRGQMELRQMDDDLFNEHRRLERQLQALSSVKSSWKASSGGSYSYTQLVTMAQTLDKIDKLLGIRSVGTGVGKPQ